MNKMIKKHKKAFLIFLFLLIYILTLGFNADAEQSLCLLDEDGKIIKEIEVDTGFQFTVTFIHSSELEPWDNIFEIGENQEIILRKIKVPSTGPGVPSVLPEGWDFKIENGYFIYDKVDKTYQKIDFIVSEISPHYLIINDEKIDLVELTNDWAKITFEIRRKNNG